MTPPTFAPVDPVPVVFGTLAFLWLLFAMIAPLTTRVTSLGKDWYEVRVFGRVLGTVTRHKYLGTQPRYVQTGERSVVGFNAAYAVRTCPVFAREDGVEFVCGPTAAGWLVELSNEVDNTKRREQIGSPPKETS